VLLGEEAVREIVACDAAKGETEVRCEFCTARYVLTTADLEALAETAASGPRT
jgi:redox-regulated HSP33 family molecular chaperone